MIHSLRGSSVDEAICECRSITRALRGQAENYLRAHGRGSAFTLDAGALIKPFRHLELDENFSVAAHFARDYHGTFGKAAAYVSGSGIPDATTDNPLPALCRLILPDGAADPMSAVFCDGTPEGYLEAVVYESILDALTCGAYESVLLFDRPELSPDQWDIFIDPADWSPKAEVGEDTCRLQIFSIRYAPFVAPSDGINYIYLKQYSFLNWNTAEYCRAAYPERFSRYPFKPEVRDRYSPQRRCCLYEHSSIVAAHLKKSQWDGE